MEHVNVMVFINLHILLCLCIIFFLVVPTLKYPEVGYWESEQ